MVYLFIFEAKPCHIAQADVEFEISLSTLQISVITNIPIKTSRMNMMLCTALYVSLAVAQCCWMVKQCGTALFTKIPDNPCRGSHSGVPCTCVLESQFIRKCWVPLLC